MTETIRLFSVDDHIIEHPRVWSDRLPFRYQDAAPHVLESDGVEYWVYEDVRTPALPNPLEGKSIGASARGRRPGSGTLGYGALKAPDYTQFPDPMRFDEIKPGAYDPAERAKDMLADGIFASVNFPTLSRFGGVLFLEFKDRELALLCVQAYNDFILDEWCPGGPPGLYVPSVITPLWDAELAARELQRCGAKGARAVLFPENTVPLGLPSLWDPYWNPVWRTCEELDLPICMHIGSSGVVPNPTPGPEAPDMLGWSLFQVGSMMSSANLMMSPVCRLHPGLKFVLSEGGIGWVPNVLERVDRMWERHKVHSGLGAEPVLPSEIFRKNIYVCMIEEPVCLKYRHDIGLDRIMWECDYPHADTVWPASQQSVASVFAAADVPAVEIDRIAHGNAERVFNWTMAAPDARPAAVPV